MFLVFFPGYFMARNSTEVSMKSSSSIVEALVLELFWCFSLSFSDPCATLVRSAGPLPAPRRRPLGPDPRAAPGRRGDGGPTGSAWPWFGYPVSPKQKPKEPVHLEDTSLHPRENPRNSPAFSLKSTSPKEVCVEQFEGLSWGRSRVCGLIGFTEEESLCLSESCYGVP